MVQSTVSTVEQYLESLPPERREVIVTLRELILKKLPAGYAETMNWGMISYEIPLADYPHTYNGRPLMYLALAAQKNYYSIYMMGVYGDPTQELRLRQGFERAGKKLDMGKSCVRFRKISDISLEVIGDLITRTSPAALIKVHEAARAARK